MAEPFDKHRYKAHRAWLEAGRSGDGRLVMRGNRISERLDAIVLDGARFEDCELVKTRFDSASLKQAELINVRGKGLFTSTDFTGARFEGCDLAGSNMQRARIVDAVIDGGDWTTVWLERGDVRRSRVTGVTFRGAHFYDCVLDETTFEGCNFELAFLSMRESSPSRLGTSRNTRFVDCDLRGVKLDGRKLMGTVFERCKLHGIEGTPEIQGAYTVIDPDFSAAGDGSDVRDAQAVYDLWGNPE